MYNLTLFTLGNGDIIFSVFNSLQALIKSALFTGLLNFVLLVGFAVLVFSSVAQGRLPITYTVKYLLFSAVFIRMLLSFTVNIGLVDLVNPANDKMLTGVPFILGLPASILSQIGRFLALEIDTFYSHAAQLPEDLTLAKGGYNIIGTLMRDSLSYRFNDPYLKKSLAYFFVDCVSPLIGNNSLSADIFLNAPSIWALVKSLDLNASLMTIYYGKQASKYHSNWGRVLTCHDASKKLDDDLQSERSSLNEKTNKAALQVLLNYTTRESSYTPSASQYLQQSALLDLLSHAVLDLMAARTHSNLLMHRLAITRSVKSVESKWITSNGVFQSTFGYLYAVLQVIVYAMVPLVIVFSILPGLRGILLKRYLQLLAWFPVTLVLMSIVSNVLATWSEQLLGNVWQVTGGLTLSGRHLVSEASYKLIEVGGWLMTIVPMIAWGLIAGLSSAMNNLWQSFTTPSSLLSPSLSLAYHKPEIQTAHDTTRSHANSLPLYNTDLAALSVHEHEQASSVTSMSAMISSPPGSINNTEIITEAMHRHLATIGHADNLPGHVIQQAAISSEHAAQASVHAAQAETNSSDHIKAKRVQAQSTGYLSQAFNRLSDHLGGGTEGKILAGSLLGVGVIAAGSALVATLPEEALATGVVSAIEGIEALAGADLSNALLGSEIVEGAAHLLKKYQHDKKHNLDIA